MRGLLTRGKVAWLWLGLMGQDIDLNSARAMNLANADGMLVNSVYDGAPAKSAGIKTGDIIRTINSSHVRDVDDYINALRNQTPGEKIRIGIIRDGQERQITVTPQDFTDGAARKLLERRWGFTAENGKNYVKVTSVSKNGPAAFLRAGDLITGIGNSPVHNLEEFLNAFRRERMATQVILQVRRNGNDYLGRLLL